MDEALKKRLIGATVLVSLAVIFLPMLLEHEPIQFEKARMQSLPPEPKRDFNERLLPPKPESVYAPVTQETPVTDNDATESIEVKTAVKPKPIETAPVAHKPQPKAKPADKPPPSGWIVQAGSYSKRDNAEALVGKLRKAGLDTMDVQPVKVNGKTLYRVRVGPEIDQKNAEKLAPRVAKISGSQAKVLKYP